MTLILNVLRNDLSVLAADKRARAEWPNTPASFSTVPSSVGQVLNDFKKVTTNSSRTLALGIAGRTNEHSYTEEIEQSDNIDAGIQAIRTHIESFLPQYDRARLNRLTNFMKNEGVATFFDQNMKSYFTYTYLFSPVELQASLHRASHENKVFYAGSGSTIFDGQEISKEIATLKSSVKNLCKLEDCIAWIKDVYLKANEINPEIGDEPTFLISTKTNIGYSTFSYR